MGKLTARPKSKSKSKPPSSSTSRTTRSRASTSKNAGGRAKAAHESASCICDGAGDDERLIACDICQSWFHFNCIHLTESRAEEISRFVCDSCQKNSGDFTTFSWEDDPMDETPQNPTVAANNRGEMRKGSEITSESGLESNDPTESGVSSGEEYETDEEVRVRPKRSSRPLRASMSKPTEPSSTVSRSTRSPSATASHRASSAFSASADDALGKRKAGQLHHPAKRARAESESEAAMVAEEHPPASSNPARKYCLGKLRDVVFPIFEQYYSTEESGDERKANLEQLVGKYATDLEMSLFSGYSEPDKAGKAAVGVKYKERFRTLTFNLEKQDRVVLRESIGSGKLTADELSTMSSAELASEEQKQQQQEAEKYSLEHSILQQRVAPRAKITHKGEQAIENLANDDELSRVRAAEAERERQLEAQKARLRIQIEATAAGDSLQSATSDRFSLPPTPTVPASHTDRPVEVVEAGDQSPPPPPSATSKGFDIADVDVEFNFSGSPTALGTSDEMPPPAMPPPISPTTFLPSPSKVSTVSVPRTLSFDLGSLNWSAKGPESGSNPPDAATADARPEVSDPPERRMDDVAFDIDFGADDLGMGDIGDQDFDVFLEQGAPQQEKEEQESSLEAVPAVWNGEIFMPMDDKPMACLVHARQIGGRTLEPQSSQWQILFPSPQARVDGRVPTAIGNKYLLDMRLTTKKELIAVAFMPSSESSAAPFDEFLNYLVKRGRHAVVLPWASRENAPGKELYLIPLQVSDPVPEYIELLDQVRLPKVRQTNVLLGVFILQKGKLVEAPPSSLAAPPQPQAAIPPPPPPPAGPPAGVFPPGSAASAEIAAAWSTMTPEQQQMVQSLLAATQVAAPIAPPPPPPQPAAPTSFPGPSYQYPYPPQPQAPMVPSYTSPFPQTTSQSSPPQPSSFHSPHYTGFASPRGHAPPVPPPGQGYENNDRYGGHDSPPRRRDSGNHDFNRPADSGWGGRGRNRGRGRGRSQASPRSNPWPQSSHDASNWERRGSDSWGDSGGRGGSYGGGWGQ
ncbi:hypothetical protein BOTBODRAFT_439248 [Botryobasidium botryosum FD-172 SS1]|uniref:Transcription factor BYE1 n=1 Tax=Botryobasidium botryosum (strain FD-172 SS1) TaxID=930990 RepID=A0A067MUL4_BOTB1|nr:hypothetical protein BOTBODRAFT_439248 [Botryobasidium botryosum FD-172 SS1]